MEQMKYFSQKKALLYIAGAIVTVVLIGISLKILYLSTQMYFYFKKPYRGIEGRIYQIDNELGYKTVPGSLGYQTFPRRDKIPVQFDQYGFRVPVKNERDTYSRKPLFLVLGGSFAFGDGCLAEESVAYLLGELSGGSAINAGMSGYGCAQMLFRARKLIPEYRPDYVIIQSSPWLISRAGRSYMLTYSGSIAAPFFTLKDGKNEIVPPPYVFDIFELPIEEYKHTQKGIFDYFSFIKNVGIPLFVNKFCNNTLTYLRIKLGVLPRPNRQGINVERDFYGELYRLCKTYGSEMVIVFCGQKRLPIESNIVNGMNRIPGVSIFNANEILWDTLFIKTDEEYEINYWQWDDKFVDPHPSSKAHKIIANAIYEKMKLDKFVK